MGTIELMLIDEGTTELMLIDDSLSVNTEYIGGSEKLTLHWVPLSYLFLVSFPL